MHELKDIIGQAELTKAHAILSLERRLQAADADAKLIDDIKALIVNGEVSEDEHVTLRKIERAIRKRYEA